MTTPDSRRKSDPPGRDLARAISGYDPAFEERLLDRIVEAIVAASMLDDGAGNPVLALRLGETAQALVTALALVLAMSPPAAHNDAAIKQTSQSFRRKLRARVHHARGNPDLHEFLRRTFNYSDRSRGGRA
jgi:hypothetical protein